MSENLHTPGPWAMQKDGVPDHITQISIYPESTGKTLATVYSTPADARLIIDTHPPTWYD